MLRITIPSIELFNEMTDEFIYFEEETIELEHSLVSISKWESKWHKPFLSDKNKTNEEVLDYVSCMSLNGPIKRDLLQRLSNDNFLQINNYINDLKCVFLFLFPLPLLIRELTLPGKPQQWERTM